MSLEIIETFYDTSVSLEAHLEHTSQWFELIYQLQNKLKIEESREALEKCFDNLSDIEKRIKVEMKKVRECNLLMLKIAAALPDGHYCKSMLQESNIKVATVRVASRKLISFLTDQEIKLGEKYTEITGEDYPKIFKEDTNGVNEEIKEKTEEALKNLPQPKMAEGKINNSSTLNYLTKSQIAEIPPFEGKPSKWPAFWEAFEISIHSHTEIPNYLKFLSLKNLLKNEPAQQAARFPSDGSQYSELVEKLKDMYGDPKKIFISLWEKLKALKCSKNDLKCARSNLNQVATIIDQMKRMKYCCDGEPYISEIRSKIPQIILKEFLKAEKLRPAGKFETMKDQLEELEKIVSLYEEVEQSSDRYTQEDDVTVINHNIAVKTEKDNRKTKSCLLCKKGHNIYNCDQYKSIKDKIKVIKEKKLCYCCARQGHSAIECRWDGCKDCTGKHHPSICKKKKSEDSSNKDKKDEKSTQKKEKEGSVKSTQMLLKSETSKMMTVIAEVGDKSKEKKKALLFIDSGADHSLITEKFAKKVKAKIIKEKIKLNISGFGDKTTPINSNLVEITVQAKPENIRILALTSPFITKCREDKELSEIDKKFLEKENIKIPKFESSEEVDILIGIDNYVSIFPSGLKATRLPSGLQLLESTVGKIICGKINANTKDMVREAQIYITKIEESEQKERDISMLFELEKSLDSDLEIKTKEIVEKYKEQIHIDEDGITAGWPWNENEKHNLGDNYDVAYRRLLQFFSNEKMNKHWPEVTKTMKNYTEKGYIEQVNKSEIYNPKGVAYYMPYHIVVNMRSETTRARIVYDASSHKKGEKSLNAVLYPGPTTTPELIHMLIRCRTGKYICSSDVEKAFNQVKLKEEDRDSVRFLYLHDPEKPPTNDNIAVYRFKVLPFGVTSSPFLLNLAIQVFVEQSDAPEYMKKSICTMRYVDNLFIRYENQSELKEIVNESRRLFAEMKMNLREFAGNDPNVEKVVPAEYRSNNEKEKLLGYHWWVKEDMMEVRIPDKILYEKLTQKEVISFVAGIFDPLNLLAPLTIEGKLLAVLMFIDKTGWNNIVSDRVREKLIDYERKMREVKLRIPRCVTHRNENIKTSLVIFCDASKDISAAVAYIRSEDNGKITNTLLMSKTKIAPCRKKLTIPQMELQALVMATKMAKIVSDQIELKIEEITIFSDSQICLHWLTKKVKESVFVDNRVKEIQRLVEIFEIPIEFRYVRTDQNVSDIATRGVKNVEELYEKKWFTGPSWLLKDKSEWPSEIIKNIKYEEVPILRLATEVGKMNILDLKFTNKLKKLENVGTYVLKFIHKKIFKKVGEKSKARLLENIPELEIIDKNEEFLVDVLKSGRCLLLRSHQKEFGIKPDKEKMRIRDESDGLIKQQTRLENALDGEKLRWITVVNPKSRYFELLVTEVHQRNAHMGINTTLANIRSAVVGKAMRRVVAKTLKKCVKCRKENAHPFGMPLAPHLPEERVKPNQRAFGNTSIDYFGPITIRKDDLSDTKKVWVCLFVCMSTRLVHLEVCYSLSTDEFLMALRRFCARRGAPERIISDNGSNFRLAEKILRKGELKRTPMEDVEEELARKNIRWSFTTPLAPWQGGIHERLVAICKKALRHTVGKKMMQRNIFETVMCEVEEIVNNRPITFIGEDPENLKKSEVLRPINCISPQWRSLTFNLQNEEDEYSSYTQMTKEIEKYVKRFWSVWQTDYLLNNEYFTQVQRLKGAKCAKDRVPEIGEIVLIKDESTKRENWRLARVKELIKSRDDEIRSAVLVYQKSANSFKTGEMRRALKHIVPLEVRRRMKEKDNEVKDTTEKVKENCRKQGPSSIKTLMVMSLMMIMMPCVYANEQFGNNSYFQELAKKQVKATTPVPFKYTRMQIQRLGIVEYGTKIKNTVYAVGKKNRQFQLSAKHVEKSTIVCTNDGVKLIDKAVEKESVYTVCTEHFCVDSESAEESEISIPAKYTVHKHSVSWRKKEFGSIKIIEAVCPATIYCLKEKCWFCLSIITNPHCHIVAASVWLVAILTTITILVMTIGKSMLKKWKIRKFWRQIEQSIPMQDMTLVNEPTAPPEEISWAQMTLAEVRNMVGGRRLSTLLTIILMMTQITASAGCDLVIPISHQETANNRIISVQDIFMSPVARTICLETRTNSTIFAKFKISNIESTQQCVKGEVMYTKNATVASMAVKHCGGVGMCTNAKCDSIRKESRIPDLEEANRSVGNTYCVPSCGGFGCGCISLTDGCLFYRTFAKADNENDFQLFQCQQWSKTIQIELEFNKEENHLSEKLSLSEGETINIRFDEKTSMNITAIVSNENIPTQIYDARFIQNHNATAIVDTNFNKFALRCDFEQCEYIERCDCKPTETDVICDCDIADLFEVVHDKQKSLPLISETFKLITNVRANPTLISRKNALHLQVTIDQIVNTRTTYVSADCNINDYTDAVGCYGCTRGAKYNVTCSAAEKSTATISCDDFFTSIRCDRSGYDNQITQHFQSAKVEQQCNVKCGNKKINLEIRGILAYVSDTDSKSQSEGSKSRASEGWEPTDFHVLPNWVFNMKTIMENFPQILGSVILLIAIVIIARHAIPLIIRCLF